MSSGRLFSEIKNHPKILVSVILFHVILVVLLSVNLLSNETPPMPMVKKHNIINAVTIDAKQYDDRKKQKELEAKKRSEDKKKAELKRKKALEKKRLVEKKKALEKKRLVEKKKALEKKRKKEIAIAKKKKAEELAKEKKEKKRLAKEKKVRELKAMKRLAEEKQRKLDEKRRAEEKAEFEHALLEEERLEEERLEEERLEEERLEEDARKKVAYQAKLLTLRKKYIFQITQKVENNWLRPATNIKGLSCDVLVKQTMMGDVIDVQLHTCSNNTAFQRSIERAVRKASPLPLPPNPDVFDREIYFTFKPRY